ncbi:MAG: ester cyclase [Chitinophagaceae bacterium]|nr:ester cyclase [Chitinophagaceae bacterium]
MKKLFFAAAAIMLCFFNSCKDSATSSSSSSDNSTNDSNLAKNRRVMKAIETGDSATINSLIADDAVDHQGPHGDIKGGDSIRHWLIDMHNHMKDLKFDLIADAANGDYVFSMTTFKGTCTDASMGMPAGTVMNEKTVDVIKVKDGKMVEHWGFLDAAEMMKMQGMGGGHMDNMDGKMDNKMAPKDSMKK